MATDVLKVTVKTRVRGLWKIVLFGWAIKLWRLGPEQITVEVKA